MMERVFDRLSSFDERSRAFPIRSLIRTGAVPRSYTWSCNVVLDQSNEGACVGFGWAGELAARPSVIPVDDSRARQIYHEARRLDEWPGEDYEGTSVLAGAKVIQQHGFMDEYRWAFSLEDVILTLGYKGPVVIGVNWHEGMWDADADGYIHVEGDIVGGHCVFVRAVNVKRRACLIQNSWGPSWGTLGNGCARISWDDLAKLLADDGEACVPVRRDRVGTW